MVRGCVSLEKRQVRRSMLTFGVVALAVTDRRRPEEFWCEALRYEVRTDGVRRMGRGAHPADRNGHHDRAADQRDAAQGSSTAIYAYRAAAVAAARISKTRPRSWRSLRRHGRRVRHGEGGNRVVLDRGPELSVERRVRHKVAVHGLRGRGHEGPGIGG